MFDINNIVPVCSNHNRAKGDMNRSEYIDKLDMSKEFSRFESINQQLKLNDVLHFKYGNEFGYPIEHNFEVNSWNVIIKYFIDKTRKNLPLEETHQIFQCPVTKMYYFYALVPAKNILNDGKECAELELQPRPLIFEHLWDLYRHLRISTQLQPSICRIDMNDGPNIFVFDGQHKAAARIWAGFGKIETKIYIEPDKIN
jgi:hypothetical protein